MEACLEELQKVANSLKKPEAPKTYHHFYDGSGKRIRSSKSCRYRSVAERASKKGCGKSKTSDIVGELMMNIAVN